MQRGKLAAAREQNQARPSDRGVTGPPPATGPGPALPPGPVGSLGARTKRCRGSVACRRRAQFAGPRFGSTSPPCGRPGPTLPGAEYPLRSPGTAGQLLGPARCQRPFPGARGALHGHDHDPRVRAPSCPGTAAAHPQPRAHPAALPALNTSCCTRPGAHKPLCTPVLMHAQLCTRTRGRLLVHTYTRSGQPGFSPAFPALPQLCPTSAAFATLRGHCVTPGSRETVENETTARPGHSTGSVNRRARPRPRCSPPPPPGRAQHRAGAVGAGTAGPGMGTAHSTPCFGRRERAKGAPTRPDPSVRTYPCIYTEK